MSRPLHLALILLLALSAVALGHARGVTHLGGQVVLCAGGTLASVRVPGEGPRRVICPDMAPGLMAGTPVAPPIVVRPRSTGVADVPTRHAAMPALPARAPQARDPPARASA